MSIRDEILAEAAEARKRMDGETLWLRLQTEFPHLDIKEVVTGYKGRNPNILEDIERRNLALAAKGRETEPSHYLYITGGCPAECGGPYAKCEHGCTVVVRLGDHNGNGHDFNFSLFFGADSRNEGNFLRIEEALKKLTPFDDRELTPPLGWEPDEGYYHCEDDEDDEEDEEDPEDFRPDDKEIEHALQRFEEMREQQRKQEKK